MSLPLTSLSLVLSLLLLSAPCRSGPLADPAGSPGPRVPVVSPADPSTASPAAPPTPSPAASPPRAPVVFPGEAGAPPLGASPTLQGKPGLRFLGVNPHGHEEYLWEKDRSVMILVPAGSFPMGRAEGEWFERPVRTVTLGAYLIDKYEVSVERYARFLASYEHRIPDRWEIMQLQERKPVVNVSWYDAGQYAYWAGKRLPTEAQWERAAVGTEARRHPWGAGALGPLRANYDSEGKRDLLDWQALLRSPGSYRLGASPVGAMDMAGNVSEWCWDWFVPTAYKILPLVDPEGPTSGEEKALRGGSFLSTGEALLPSRRGRSNPAREALHIGFRTVLPVAELEQVAGRVVSSSEGVGNLYESDTTRVDRVAPITPVRDPVTPELPPGLASLPGFRFHRVNPEGRAEYLHERDRFVVVHVPAGSFPMGSAAVEDRCEGPVHRVSLEGFLLSREEVSVERYAKFLRATGHRAPPNWERQRLHPELPVAWVSHEDARVYARWCGMRLPREAEWEFAARGPEGRTYPWGEEAPDASRVVCGKPWVDDPYESGVEVSGQRPAGRSPFGLQDMTGNLWEWVEDWFACGYPEGEVHAPEGVATGRRRVARGGSWREACSEYHRATTRMSFFPEERLNHLGFRVAASLPASTEETP